MKYITANKTNSLILFDEKNEIVNGIDSTCTNIDYLWIAPEDGTITINGDLKPVEAGDIILRMYGINDDYNREYVLLKDYNLKSYYKRLIDYNNLIREKYAIKDSPVDDKCLSENRHC
jgi:hypothetical protein